MKFIRVITKHTSEEMDKIVSSFDDITFQIMLRFYETFSHVEYVTEDGFVAMYAVIDEKSIEKLFHEYIKWDVDFSYEDITRPVLLSKLVPEIKNEQENASLKLMIETFLEDNLDVDTVLDKISEDKGLHTLTEREKRVLEPVN